MTEYERKRSKLESENLASEEDKREYEPPQLSSLGAVNKIVKASGINSGPDGAYS